MGGICFNQPHACTVSEQRELYRKLGQAHRRKGCRNIKEGEKDIKFAYGSCKREEKNWPKGKQKSWVTGDPKQSNAQTETQMKERGVKQSQLFFEELGSAELGVHLNQSL